ncbi:MAG: hypothetical protein ACRDYD_10660 [Acidimicrobiales bacterium]
MSGPARPAPDCQTGAVDLTPALGIADAVLYEGYLLYPYRPSSTKSRVPWQFGVLAPRGWVVEPGPAQDGVAGSAESWWNRTECLLEARPEARVELRLRFLQLAHEPDGRDEALAREEGATFLLGDLLGGERTVSVEARGVPGSAAAGEAAEPSTRRCETVLARMVVRADRVPAPFALHKLTVRVENAVSGVDASLPRGEALRRSMVSAHLLLGVAGGSFLSLLDPPEWACAAAAECRNVRAFPVLAGPAGSDRIVLSAPIILYDHPEVAPESPGDLFDATEIDEILSLRILTLTEAEKAEARAAGARARELVDRVDTMPPEILARLHGAVRSLRPVTGSGGQGSPHGGSEPDAWRQLETPVEATGDGSAVLVAGVTVRAGSRVRLRPRARGTDAQDMFLAGRAATVVDVLDDVDGSRFVAVSLDDDPRAALAAGPGRLRHFSPDEIDPLPIRSEARL